MTREQFEEQIAAGEKWLDDTVVVLTQNLYLAAGEHYDRSPHMRRIVEQEVQRLVRWREQCLDEMHSARLAVIGRLN